ncbi:MAG: bifunctional precorrin-2 dehydrogenase/sirohydrochlorin ferrochelatase [Desulfobacter sp.]|nr:MAG: bifunctional precorrin-2 dehydrogenase/sirohydrochlorin ferrochelatase [Desulfobacter sp.]
MKYYPIFLDVAGKTCLVVGGGKVGARKALGLAKAGARVRVVSLGFSPELAAAPHDNICLEKKAFAPGDLDGACLVFAATDNLSLNAGVREAARKAGVLCNIADGKDKGDFILPAVVDRGELQVAVSTGGASPAVARRLRVELESLFGPEYEIMLTLMANIRKELLARGHDPQGHKKIFTALAGAGLPDLIAGGKIKDIDNLLARLLGEGFSFDSLAGQAT